MKTSVVQPPAAVWYVVDADGQTLGRVAAKVAHVLRGKHRPSFSPHQFPEDHVIILNIEKLSITQKKLEQKTYYHHTGYLGHMRTRTLGQLMEEKPEQAMIRAVKGMLPYNRLKPRMLKHLHVLTGSEHPYAAQKPVSLDLSTL